MGIEQKQNLQVLIVEDEPIIAYSTQGMLEQMGFRIFQIVHSKANAIVQIESGTIDLAILDINLGEGEEGLDLAKTCASLRIPFLYVSSYGDKKTLDKAIQTAPGAYIIKPFLYPNLYSAVNLTLQQAQEKEKTYFSFKSKGALVKVDFDDILYLAADNIYVDIVTQHKTYLYRSSLKKMLDTFPKDQFAYTHRAYVVNLKHISTILTDTVEVSKKSIPLSRMFRRELTNLFLSNQGKRT